MFSEMVKIELPQICTLHVYIVKFREIRGRYEIIDLLIVIHKIIIILWVSVIIESMR